MSETLSTKAKPEQINKRLFDLCRYQRSELLHSGLITENEFSFLLWDCDLAQGAGSPSPRRLEDYDEVRAKLTALTRRLAERGWQPIETAPGDRIHVDLWAGRRIPNAYWSEELGDWMADGLGLLKWCSARPTHWMPLPQPPEPAGEGGV